MVLRRLLTRLAAGAPVPVLPVAGLGMRDALRELRIRPELRPVDVPAAASVLVAAGSLPEEFGDPLALLHDGMPHPRAVVWWNPGNSAGPLLRRFADPTVVDGSADELVSAVVRVRRELYSGHRPSSEPVLAETGRAPWEGVGPYGQGGSGMTGGVPYGRPLAEVAPDRDGLRLDVVPLTVGPFFPQFPPGLRLEATFSGDVVVDCLPLVNPFVDIAHHALPVRPGLDVFFRALFEPVPIAELELARARDHLVWLADALSAHGLPALGVRALRLTHELEGTAAVPGVRRLSRAIEWSQVLRWSTRGVGRFDAAGRTSLGGCGPVARAAGLPDDARMEDATYRALGFELIVQDGADAAARWRQRLAEVVQSLALAKRAGAQRSEVTGQVESPRGLLTAGSAPASRLLPLLPGLLEGLEWGDAVATIVSLDIDLEEAGLAERLASAQAGAT